MKPVTLASVYMDKGEGFDYLREQVNRMAKMKPEMYFIDFICKPDQLIEASKLTEQFYYLINELLPELDRSKVFVGITCDAMIRPAATALVVINKINDNDVSFMDVNPERKPR